MATNNIGKATSGSPFRPPPAVIWNNMVDAGVAFAEGRFDAGSQPPIRPRSTDIIKIFNDSGASRSKGHILRIDGKALTTISDESLWLTGVEPTDDGYFGILKEPVVDQGIAPLQVSGCCFAVVDVSDITHTRATAVAGEYILVSADDGPLEILYAPGSTGEQDCVVRFAAVGGTPTQIISFAIVSSDPTLRSALVEVRQKTFTGLAYGEDPDTNTLTVYDTDGCWLNEPNVDLTGRLGKAVLQFVDAEAEAAHFEYDVPEKYFNVLTLCCANLDCS